ncbi:MAG: addiction module protein [Chlorobium sp.]|nr:addiction module protein [Chlorobium sp.]
MHDSEAKILPNDSKAILAEKLVAGIEDDRDSLVTKSHLDEVKKRRDEIRTGKVVPINGEKGLAQVRTMIEK